MIIKPTVTADNPHTYREQIERITGFAKDIHIDLADGQFAPTHLINPIQVWWPEDVQADIHMMYLKPEEHIETLISLKPRAVYFHSTSEGNILGLMRELQAVGIKAGIALLPNSQPEDFANEVEVADEVLIFAGHLGYHGGDADLSQLEKVARIKEINSVAEIAWDGGITDQNIDQLAEQGITIFNVGSFIQKAEAPQEAYDILTEKLKQ